MSLEGTGAALGRCERIQLEQLRKWGTGQSIAGVPHSTRPYPCMWNHDVIKADYEMSWVPLGAGQRIAGNYGLTSANIYVCFFLL